MENTYNYDKYRIVAAIPAYNEEKYIGNMITETKKYVDKVIVLDDGSSDNTADVAKKKGAEVIQHKTNKGKGAAVNTICKTVKEINPQSLILLDGDNQHNPDEIPLLLEPTLSENYDMVIGSRFLSKKNNIPKYRMLGQHILTLTTNLGSGIKVTDSQSGYRAFSNRALQYLDFKENGLSLESEMQFLAGKYNFKVKEIPISTIYDGNLKRSPIIHGFGVLFRVLKLIILLKPRLVLIPASFVFMVIIFGYRFIK